jgi:hypothetical protein
MSDTDKTLHIQPVWDTSILQPISPIPISNKTTAIENAERFPPKDFMISVSPKVIDFGELSPTNPLLREMEISVLNKSSDVYTVFVSEASPPANGDVFIPDTSCDNSACTEQVAGPWENILTYGYGYRCDDTENRYCDMVFKNNNYYKQFPAISYQKNMQPIITGKKKAFAKVKLTFKLNIAGSQAVSGYTNTVTYILAPGF